MTPLRIEKFFATLAAELAIPSRVYLTGAAAAALWGRVRPSIDIDFGIEPVRQTPDAWKVIEAAVARASARTGIAASAAADIDRWGMITLLDYRRSSRLYRRFGKLGLRLLDPVNWAIGKLTRFLEPDIEDIVQVFRRQRVPAPRAARTWGRALQSSSPSTAQFQFRGNVERFITNHGHRIWGRQFDPDKSIRVFRGRAGISLW